MNSNIEQKQTSSKTLEQIEQLEQENGCYQEREAEEIPCSSGKQSEKEEVGWKWEQRHRIWNYMEQNDLLLPPRPVHYRIPNFKGLQVAAAMFMRLPEVQSATVVKVNPGNTPQRQIRFLVLKHNKILITAEGGLSRKFLVEIRKEFCHRHDDRSLMTAVTSRGMSRVGRWIGLSDECLRPSIIVVASVLVGLNGGRIGKGKGLGDLEYGIMRQMGWLDGTEIVATTVHECQVMDEIPTKELRAHDVPVDIIVTPERVIRTNTTIPKPKQVYWDNLGANQLNEIAVLRDVQSVVTKR